MPPKASAAAARPRRSSARTTPRKTTSELADVKSSPQSTTDASPETTAPPPTTTTTAAAINPATSSNLHVADIDPQIDSESALPETSIVKVTEANPKIGEKSGDSSVGTLVENASETKESGATKTVGARTVVKKTVRVVKRVVKKKVPKRVPKDQAIISSVEELGKVELVDNGSENPNPSSVLGDMEVENPNSVGSEPNASVSMELGKVELEDDGSENPNPSNVLGDTEVENPNSFGSEPNASLSMEIENSNSDVVVLMEAENPNSDLGESSNFDVLGSKQVENLEEHEAAPVTELVEVTTETHLGDQNERLIGDRNDELETENVGCGGGESKEGVKEKDVMEGLDVGGLKGEVETGDVVWSGEMEALERRKRRKTEVFVGGLDKDAKEEDIRKVLQEVGEIVEVRLVMNEQTGKNKGFAFVRYASSADAKKALTKFARVEICGKQCGAVPVEGNDTIFLGNIDKKWKSEDIVKLLQEIGIEKMDKVTVVADPNNIECNRGFAFLELETCRDAQNAYRILQKKDVFGKHQKIKVAWAEPLSEPDEEEMLKVKTVYAEYLPSSWDEEKVKDYFKKFGEIENVVLARNLHSSRRKDFAFVNYRSREAALACIEAFNHESLNHEDSKVNVKVSLAKPMPKGRQVKNVSNPVSKEPPKEKMKANQSVIKPHQPRNKINYASSNHVDVRVTKSSTTAELVQLLREQASWKQPQTNLGTNSVGLDYPRSSPARKRPFSLREDPLYLDPRGYSRTRVEGSFTAAATTSGLSQGIGVRSLPYYNRQEAGYASGSFYRDEDYHNSLQARGGAPYHGSSGAYRRY